MSRQRVIRDFLMHGRVYRGTAWIEPGARKVLKLNKNANYQTFNEVDAPALCECFMGVKDVENI